MTLSRRPRSSPAPAITRREHQVLEHFRRGLTAPETALALGLSQLTVEKYGKFAYRKLEITSRAELAQLTLPAPRDLRRERPRMSIDGRTGDVAICEACGREFRRWRPRRRGRFCSSSCSSRSHAATARAGAEVRRCKVCGLPFVPQHRAQRHCSRACSRVSAVARLRELGRARRMPPAQKLERRRAQWREAKRRRRAPAGAEA